MKQGTEIILLISVIAIAFVAIYIGMPGSAGPALPDTYPPPAQQAPVVAILETVAGFTSYGAPDFYGTVKSNTAVPVTAEIAADIYDESGKVQLAHGDTEVGITPYGQSPSEVIINKRVSFPVNWEYRVYVKGVH